MVNKPNLYSEVTLEQKKRFYIFVAVFISGFILLAFIGNSINQDGFVILSFLSPLIIFIGIVGIIWSLYRVPTGSAFYNSEENNAKPQSGSRK